MKYVVINKITYDIENEKFDNYYEAKDHAEYLNKEYVNEYKVEEDTEWLLNL